MSNETSSAELIERLRKGKDDYVSSPEVRRELAERGTQLVTISGALGSGKTTFTEAALAHSPDIRAIDTTTNRPHKDSDPEGFRTDFPLTQLAEDIDRGRVVNYDVIGQTVYATYPESLTEQYYTGPITTGSIDQLLGSFGAEALHCVYVVTPVELWKDFIKKSLGDRHDTIAGRMPETRKSLQDALDNLDLFTFIENQGDPASLVRAADVISDLAHQGYTNTNLILSPDHATSRLKDMLAHTDTFATE